MDLFYAFLPELVVVLVLLLIEQRKGQGQHDGWRNLQVTLLQIAVVLFLVPLLHGWAGPALIDGAHLPFWAGLLIFFVVRDGLEWLFHVAQHRIPFLWALHSLHHSDPNMSVLTTQRHYWADPLIKQVTIWSATLMVIRPTGAIAFAFGIASLWNFFAHADLPINFGRWSWVLNSPAYHRRHHSTQPEHYDQNFAAVLPIFDLLCGFYRRPEGRPTTGMPRRPQSLGEVLIWPLIWNKPRAVEGEREAPASAPHLQA
ncbi:sterol desaturase family protein [Novosphingobium terrae]|uniref:sterol desaturase family protein n=1 Tax=Novosphingobium terrae TaxID=2726189 RepID=UPI001981333E|nr:sterol desaturase family protein [Novosphingobium terrae]